MIKCTKLKVRVTFVTELLGTASANPNIYTDYIAAKSKNSEKIEEEVEAVLRASKDAENNKEGEKTKIVTIFPRNEEGEPVMYDYQWKGYFKEAASALKRIPKSISAKKDYRAYKKIIDKLVFPEPRMIPIHLSGEMGYCQRPLRGQTPSGEIIALSNSETVPVGSFVEFSIKMYSSELLEEWIKELLEYGVDGGTGQWRSGGKGKFTVTYLD